MCRNDESNDGIAAREYTGRSGTDNGLAHDQGGAVPGHTAKQA